MAQYNDAFKVDYVICFFRYDVCNDGNMNKYFLLCKYTSVKMERGILISHPRHAHYRIINVKVFSPV